MLLHDLEKKGLIKPPQWMTDNMVYLTITGSMSYGTADTSAAAETSDMDLYGVCLAPKWITFPHLEGKIPDFDEYKPPKPYVQHHIYDPDALGGKGREYDLTVTNLVQFFKLLLVSNPSCLGLLFTPHECVVHMTQVGNLMRERRKMFLHKGCWPKYKGYSFAMLHKMQSKEPDPDSKRAALREKYGFDVKYGQNLVRLLCEVEQILTEGDLDLRRNKEHLKSIRRGEVSQEDILSWMNQKERDLESVYANSTLPAGPDRDAIRQLLLDCLEMHYGSLGDAVVQPDKYFLALRNIRDELSKVNL